ncbi:hypothetical protein [Desulfogranum mediterraneum]|uniref:hypothetical protein n=1 Tax=Desulfogranum mediterraneum TaxID=160661 RepID=UPI00048E785B|nr:hypothetical protein [Desulfogranum mediterraneum]
MNANRCTATLIALTILLSIPQVTQSSEYRYPGNSKVLLYAPGYSTPNDEQKDIADDGQEVFFEAEHFNTFTSPVAILGDAAASVEMVKKFGDYGTVIMHTHGWYWDSTTGIGPFPGFRTGTVALEYGVAPDNGLVDDQYLDDLLFWRLAVSKKPNTVGVYHYVVLPWFVEKYVDSMDDTFMYLGFCSSMHNDEMWKVFKAKGAKVAFGWSRKIYRETNETFFIALMEKMLPGDENVKPLTVAESFATIPQVVWDESLKDKEDNYANGRIIFKPDSPDWGNFIFKDPEYIVAEFK